MDEVEFQGVTRMWQVVFSRLESRFRFVASAEPVAPRKSLSSHGGQPLPASACRPPRIVQEALQ